MGVDTQDSVEVFEEEKTYKIYEYMENHHSLLIASISAVVAVGSLATSVLNYVYQCIVLQNWNVSMELVGEVKRGKYFYITILGALYYFCVPIYQMCIQKIFKKYYYYFPLAKMKKKLIKKLYRLNRSRKKYWKEALNDMNKSINVIKRLAIKKVLGVTSLASLFLAFFMFLFQISLGNVKGLYLVVVGVVFLLILLGIVVLGVRRAIDRRKIKEFKKRTWNIKNSKDAVDLLRDISEYEASLSSLIVSTKRTMKESFCDKSIGTFIELMIETFACLCIFFVMSGYMTAKTQKAFWIYQDDVGKNYAVVYQNEEKAILKEANIKDDTIVINLDKQMIKMFGENQFEYMEFEHVERIEGMTSIDG